MDSAGRRLSITEAAVEDAADFAEFFRSAWSESGPDAPGFTGASEKVIDQLTAPEAFRRRVGGPDRRIFLARDGDRVVGFSSTRRASEEELSGIIILRSFEGLGIGTGLVEAAIAVAQNDGYGVMIVKTETTNLRVRSFYERRGFRVVGTDTEHVDDVAVDVSMLSMPL